MVGDCRADRAGSRLLVGQTGGKVVAKGPFNTIMGLQEIEWPFWPASIGRPTAGLSSQMTFGGPTQFGLDMSFAGAKKIGFKLDVSYYWEIGTTVPWSNLGLSRSLRAGGK